MTHIQNVLCEQVHISKFNNSNLFSTLEKKILDYIVQDEYKFFPFMDSIKYCPRDLEVLREPICNVRQIKLLLTEMSGKKRDPDFKIKAIFFAAFCATVVAGSVFAIKVLSFREFTSTIQKVALHGLSCSIGIASFTISSSLACLSCSNISPDYLPMLTAFLFSPVLGIILPLYEAVTLEKRTKARFENLIEKLDVNLNEIADLLDEKYDVFVEELNKKISGIEILKQTTSSKVVLKSLVQQKNILDGALNNLLILKNKIDEYKIFASIEEEIQITVAASNFYISENQ